VKNPEEESKGTAQVGPQAAGQPAPIRCEQARESIARFLGSGFKIGADAERQGAMRAHIQVCDDCSEHYRNSVETTAALTGAMRSKELRDARTKLRGKDRPRLGGLGAMSVLFAMAGKKPTNKMRIIIWRLRPIVITSFFIFLMMQFNKPLKPGPAFRVQWQAGTLLLDGKHLRDTQPNMGMPRGVQCTTKLDSVAQIVHGGSSLTLFANSSVLGEGVAPPRIRLVFGDVELEGSIELTSTAGQITLAEGRAYVSLRNSILTIECLDGSLEILTSGGEKKLVAGEVHLLDDTGSPLPIPPNPKEGGTAGPGAG
jgi:hypothetical protein